MLKSLVQEAKLHHSDISKMRKNQEENRNLLSYTSSLSSSNSHTNNVGKLADYMGNINKSQNSDSLVNTAKKFKKEMLILEMNKDRMESTINNISEDCIGDDDSDEENQFLSKLEAEMGLNLTSILPSVHKADIVSDDIVNLRGINVPNVTPGE